MIVNLAEITYNIMKKYNRDTGWNDLDISYKGKECAL